MDTHLLLGMMIRSCFFARKFLIDTLNVCSSLAYVFVIGRGQKSWVSLPAGKGLRLSVAEERDRRLSGKPH